MGQEPKIALHEEDLYEKVEIKEESRGLIVFRILQEWYGVDVAKVQEIVKNEKITYLPSSPPHIVGIFSLRGQILSATDLRSVFGLPQEKVAESSTLVIVKSGILETGFLVDGVAEITEVPLSKIEPTLATIASGQTDYIEGHCKMDQKLIGILKVEEILKRHS